MLDNVWLYWDNDNSYDPKTGEITTNAFLLDHNQQLFNANETELYKLSIANRVEYPIMRYFTCAICGTSECTELAMWHWRATPMLKVICDACYYNKRWIDILH